MTARHQSSAVTSIVWVNPVSGLWRDAADWSTGTAPNASSSVTISSSSTFAVTIAASAAAQSLLLEGYGVTLTDDASLRVASTLTVDGATLELGAGASLRAATLSLSNYGALQLDGGSFKTATDLILNEAEIVGTGTLVTEGRTSIYGNSDIYLSNLSLDGVGWTNTGVVNDGTDIFVSANTGQTLQIVNAASGTLNLLTGGSEVSAGLETGYGQGGAVFTNAGLLTAGSSLEFADLTCAIGLPTTNTGTIVVENGQTLIFEEALTNRGSIVIGDGSNLLLKGGGRIGGDITGPGAVTLEAGTYTTSGAFGFGALTIGDIFGESPTPAASVLSLGGTLTDPSSIKIQNTGVLQLLAGADITVGGALQLGLTFDGFPSDNNIAGTITGAGTLVTRSFSLGGDVNQVAGLLGGGLTWENTGTAVLNAVLLLDTGKNGVTIINEAGATFLDDNGALFGGTNRVADTLTNDGTLSSETAYDSTYGDYLQCDIVNNGLILVVGTGTAGQASNGSFVFGEAFTNDSSGSVQIAGGGALGLNNGAHIAGSITGTSGGVYLSYGHYVIDTSIFNVGTLQAIGDTRDTATINLNNSDWGPGIFLNAEGGTFSLTGTASILTHGSVTMENAGLLVRTGARGSTISGALTNTGTILVAAGTLAVGALSGTGLDKIDGTATLDLTGALGAGQTLQFIGTGGTLIEALPESIAELAGFAAGDHLDLQGINANAASISGTVLTVSNASTSYSFGSTGLLGDSAMLTTNANGDALVTIVAGAQHVR
jgi:hypothetical protein